MYDYDMLLWIFIVILVSFAVCSFGFLWYIKYTERQEKSVYNIQMTGPAEMQDSGIDLSISSDHHLGDRSELFSISWLFK